MAKKVFKRHQFGQIMLLPPSLDEMIDKNHPVRIVNQIIDQIDITPLEKKYKGGGTSSYHPRVLLKVLVYAYLDNVYSSRRIEACLKENIHYMWVSGMSTPDHNTINRFRGERLQEVLKQVFSQVVMLLVDHGIVNLKEVYLDGTKIEANASRYSFVWGKSIKNNKKRIENQLEELWTYACGVAQQEMKDTEPLGFEQIAPEAVKQAIEKIDHALKDKEVDKKVSQKVKYAKKNWPENLKRYEDQEKILGKRNNYSKTDPDASFMRMKEDHMKNGQLKPGYNLQISTQDQFILHYSLHQNQADTLTLCPHMEEFKDQYDNLPDVLVADAGYGSEENYEYLENEQIEAFVKFGYFHLEQQDKFREDPSKQENLYYHAQDDCFYCPMGQKMVNIGTETKRTDNDYERLYTKYQAKNCQGCPMRGVCNDQKSNRVISVNHKLRKYKDQVRQRLMSEPGIAHRKKRPVDVEPVFGDIKYNKNFRRFNLRGLPKVEIEAGLLAIAHNLAKMIN